MKIFDDIFEEENNFTGGKIFNDIFENEQIENVNQIGGETITEEDIYNFNNKRLDLENDYNPEKLLNFLCLRIFNKLDKKELIDIMNTQFYNNFDNLFNKTDLINNTIVNSFYKNSKLNFLFEPDIYKYFIKQQLCDLNKDPLGTKFKNDFINNEENKLIPNTFLYNFIINYLKIINYKDNEQKIINNINTYLIFFNDNEKIQLFNIFYQITKIIVVFNFEKEDSITNFLNLCSQNENAEIDNVFIFTNNLDEYFIDDETYNIDDETNKKLYTQQLEDLNKTINDVIKGTNVDDFKKEAELLPYKSHTIRSINIIIMYYLLLSNYLNNLKVFIINNINKNIEKELVRLTEKAPVDLTVNTDAVANDTADSVKEADDSVKYATATANALVEALKDSDFELEKAAITAAAAVEKAAVDVKTAQGAVQIAEKNARDDAMKATQKANDKIEAAIEAAENILKNTLEAVDFAIAQAAEKAAKEAAAKIEAEKKRAAEKADAEVKKAQEEAEAAAKRAREDAENKEIAREAAAAKAMEEAAAAKAAAEAEAAKAAAEATAALVKATNTVKIKKKWKDLAKRAVVAANKEKAARTLQAATRDFNMRRKKAVEAKAAKAATTLQAATRGYIVRADAKKSEAQKVAEAKRVIEELKKYNDLTYFGYIKEIKESHKTYTINNTIYTINLIEKTDLNNIENNKLNNFIDLLYLLKIIIDTGESIIDNLDDHIQPFIKNLLEKVSDSNKKSRFLSDETIDINYKEELINLINPSKQEGGAPEIEYSFFNYDRSPPPAAALATAPAPVESSTSNVYGAQFDFLRREETPAAPPAAAPPAAAPPAAPPTAAHPSSLREMQMNWLMREEEALARQEEETLARQEKETSNHVTAFSNALSPRQPSSNIKLFSEELKNEFIFFFNKLLKLKFTNIDEIHKFFRDEKLLVLTKIEIESLTLGEFINKVEDYKFMEMITNIREQLFKIPEIVVKIRDEYENNPTPQEILDNERFLKTNDNKCLILKDNTNSEENFGNFKDVYIPKLINDKIKIPKNEDIFEHLDDPNKYNIMGKITSKKSVKLFGYGFSGSGKTYTLTEGSYKDPDDPSNMDPDDPSLLQHIINRIKQYYSYENKTTEIEVSINLYYPHYDNDPVKKANHSEIQDKIKKEINQAIKGINLKTDTIDNNIDFLDSKTTKTFKTCMDNVSEILQKYAYILPTSNNSVSSRAFTIINLKIDKVVNMDTDNPVKLNSVQIIDLPGLEKKVDMIYDYFFPLESPKKIKQEIIDKGNIINTNATTNNQDNLKKLSPNATNAIYEKREWIEYIIITEYNETKKNNFNIEFYINDKIESYMKMAMDVEIKAKNILTLASNNIVSKTNISMMNAINDLKTKLDPINILLTNALKDKEIVDRQKKDSGTVKSYVSSNFDMKEVNKKILDVEIPKPSNKIVDSVNKLLLFLNDNESIDSNALNLVKEVVTIANDVVNTEKINIEDNLNNIKKFFNVSIFKKVILPNYSGKNFMSQSLPGEHENPFIMTNSAKYNDLFNPYISFLINYLNYKTEFIYNYKYNLNIDSFPSIIQNFENEFIILSTGPKGNKDKYFKSDEMLTIERKETNYDVTNIFTNINDYQMNENFQQICNFEYIFRKIFNININSESFNEDNIIYINHKILKKNTIKIHDYKSPVLTCIAFIFEYIELGVTDDNKIKTSFKILFLTMLLKFIVEQGQEIVTSLEHLLFEFLIQNPNGLSNHDNHIEKNSTILKDRTILQKKFIKSPYDKTPMNFSSSNDLNYKKDNKVSQYIEAFKLSDPKQATDTNVPILKYYKGYSYKIYSNYSGMTETVNRKFLKNMNEVLEIDGKSRFVNILAILRRKKGEDLFKEKIVNAAKDTLEFGELLMGEFNCKPNESKPKQSSPSPSPRFEGQPIADPSGMGGSKTKKNNKFYTYKKKKNKNKFSKKNIKKIKKLSKKIIKNKK